MRGAGVMVERYHEGGAAWGRADCESEYDECELECPRCRTRTQRQVMATTVRPVETPAFSTSA